MRDSGKNLIGQVLSGHARQDAATLPGTSRARVVVELVFERADGVAIKQAEADESQELKVDAEYVVLVILRVSDHWDALDISDGLEPTLQWREDDPKSPITGHADPIHTASLLAQGSLQLEYRVTVAKAAAPSERELVVKLQGSRREPQVLRRRAVLVTRGGAAAPKELRTPLQASLEPEDLPNVAMVHIAAPKEGRMHVTAYHRREPFNRKFAKLNRSLADFDGQKPSRAVYEAVLAYSMNAVTELLAWLDAVLKNTGEKVRIVVVEHDDSGVPWEMLVLENETPPLGARVLVTRWTDVRLFKDTVPLDPTAKLRHEGSVLHFVDRMRHDQSTIEFEELEQCAGVDCKSVEELKEHLEEPPKDMALVFLSCHGTFAQDEAHQAELAAAKVAGSGITPLNLGGLRTPRKRPAIVVNACHSARIARTKEHYVWGLPKFFLAKYASSYLGTLGAVDETFAAELGRDLLQMARAEGGIDLAQFVFDMRKRAWQKFNTGKLSERNFWAFVSAFMYVLYGPLENRILLLPRNGGG